MPPVLRKNEPARTVLAALGALGLSTLLPGPAEAAAPLLQVRGPLVQSIGADAGDDHTDITVILSCSVHYLASMPISHGASTRITLRLGPDCGSLQGGLATELPQVGGSSELVTGARVDGTVPGEVSLELTWSKPLDFLIAPAPSGTELRIRLLENRRRRSQVLLTQDQAPDGYAVNLDSELTAFGHEALQEAATRLQTQVYESQLDIEDQHWYRLRAGPFATQQEAERVLQAALGAYPRAWVTLSDDQADDLAVIQQAGVASADRGPTDPPLPDAEREQLLRDARAALAKHQYPQALDILNRLLRQPEYPARPDAQELVGLVRERAGELAQAKAEYQEYLRRYPHGAGVERVQARLRALAAASLSSPSTGAFTAAADRNTWSMAGSGAVSYQYESDQSQSGGSGNTATSAALVYGDLLMRERGTRYDFTTRIDAGYTRIIGQSTGGTAQDRTTAAYIELTDRQLQLTGRVGRQSLASLGAIGLFDGVYLGYQATPMMSVSAAAGLPAYTGYSALGGNARFGTVAAEFDPFHQSWVFDTYFIDQIENGATDRRSVGFQVRHSVSGRTLTMLVDYDLAFQQLNSATLIGNTRLGDSWILGFDADHRRSPLLELNNALIGQSAPDLATLAESFTPSQLRQLALDRTATSDTGVLSLSRSFGERWNFMFDIAALQLGATPASDGVPATPATGLDKNASVQLSGASVLQADDLQILGLRFDLSPQSRSATVSWDARFALGGAWRLGPRFSVEELNQPMLGGRQLLYLPQVRTDWTGRNSIFEFTAGYQILQQSLDAQAGTLSSLQQRSIYVSATYRVRF